MSDPKSTELMEKIVSLSKRRGFIYPSSEVYGGINGFWDYGPLGAELKRNVKDLWWRSMVHYRDDVVGLEATIIMHPLIWKASGHLDTFSDPMSTCRQCKKLVRSDQAREMVEDADWFQELQRFYQQATQSSPVAVSAESLEKLAQATRKHAPSLALVRAREAVTARLLASAANNGPDWADENQFIRSVSTENAAAGLTHFPCPHCGGELTEPRPFNLMFKTHYGPVESDDNVCYLRPETAQAIFVQFKNVFETSRQKLPFGIAQVGKAFRNEVTPRNFTFRSREFEQMELEFFIKPDEAVAALAGGVASASDGAWQGTPQPDWGWEVWHKYWVEQRVRFYESIGLAREDFVEYWQKPDELAHYARATVDILFRFPFGVQELEGIAARGDFDLTQHQKFSGKSTEVFDEELRSAWAKLDEPTRAALRARHESSLRESLLKKGIAGDEATAQAAAASQAYFEKLAKGHYVPHVIEPSAGVDRLILALLCKAYREVVSTDEKGKTETRVVLQFHPRIAPIKVGVFPLLKNKPELVAKALAVRDLLRPHMTVFYDESGAIGRRYARQDEAGTPFGVTIDFDTLGEKPELADTVTLRHRDDGRQERLPIADLLPRLLPLIR
jgi:glycyl-tRNA synthetase